MKFAAALLILAAGCLGSPPDETPGTSSSSSTSSGLPSIDILPPTIPAQLDLTNCHGVGFAIDTNRNLFSPSFPAGWEPKPTQTAMAIVQTIFRCDRIGWGAFERPVTFAMEFIDTFSPAEECFSGDFVAGWLLQSLLIDDAELVTFARETYGLPAQFVQFEETIVDLQTARLINWTIDYGSSQGELYFEDLPGESFQGAGPLGRYFWSNGQGISYFDWHDRHKDDQLAIRATYGVMPPPSLYGRSMLPDEFASARISIFQEGSVRAPIQRFGDLECKQPLV